MPALGGECGAGVIERGAAADDLLASVWIRGGEQTVKVGVQVRPAAVETHRQGWVLCSDGARPAERTAVSTMSAGTAFISLT